MAAGKQSIALTLLRQIGLLIPLAWVLSHIGVNYVWMAFPITEIITAAAGFVFYLRFPMKNVNTVQKEREAR